MTILTRRSVLTGAAATAALAACDNSVQSNGMGTIDQRVEATRNYLFTRYPTTRDLAEKSTGELVMPLMTEAALGWGGGYGRGAMLVDGMPVDYYSAVDASVGPRIGAQQYAHTLFFMTDEALYDFRSSPGWEAGADIGWAFRDRGGALVASTTTSLLPIIGVVYGQAGLMAGASLTGTKYTRIIP